MKRISNLILFALVFTLAAADWLSAPTTAQPAVGNQAPSQVPAAALLTGATLQRATLEGLEIELDGTPDEGYVLALHNPSARPRVAHYEVDCVQRTGSALSRMPPTPMVINTERVEVTVPAEGTVRVRLEADVSPPATDENADANVVELGFGSFTSTSFRLRRSGTESDATPLAELRWPVGASEAG